MEVPSPKIRRNRYSLKNKMEIVNSINDYRKRGMSLEAAANINGISRFLYYKWSKVVEEKVANPDKIIDELHKKSENKGVKADISMNEEEILNFISENRECGVTITTRMIVNFVCSINPHFRDKSDSAQMSQILRFIKSHDLVYGFGKARSQKDRQIDESVVKQLVSGLTRSKQFAMDIDETPNCQLHHHRIRFICVNDVYSFDDDISSSSRSSSPRGGWCRAATLMKQLGNNIFTPQHSSSSNRSNNNRSSNRSNNNQHSNEDNGEENNNRQNKPSVFTVANGDLLGGSSLLQHSKGRIAIDVLNSIPVDLAVLGNREFDHGDDVLMQRVMESNFAWLGSNVYYPKACQNDDDEPQPDPSLPDGHAHFPGIHGKGKLYTISPDLKLGIFGLVTKQTPKISSPSPKVIFDGDILAVARRTAQSLRADGAHVIVAMTHISEAEDRLLASDNAAGVDLILGGHEHEPLAAMVQREDCEEEDRQEDEERTNEGGVLVFKCGMNAYWVGSVDLDINYETTEQKLPNKNETNRTTNLNFSNTRVTSIATSWSMHAVTSRIAEDRKVSIIVKKHRKEIDHIMMLSSFGKEIASTLSLNDVISCIGSSPPNANDENNHTKSITSPILPLDTRTSSVRRREATGGNMVADAMHWYLRTNLPTSTSSLQSTNLSTLPLLAMINGGFIRGDRLYKSGSKITVRQILKEVPFPRVFSVLAMEGAYLKEALGQQLKGSSKGPTGSFPHLSSNARLFFSSASSNVGENEEEIVVHSLAVNGVEVKDDETYLIAVTSFVAEGNEGCPSWLKGVPIKNDTWENTHISCVVLKYLQSHPIILPTLEGRVVCCN